MMGLLPGDAEDGADLLDVQSKYGSSTEFERVKRGLCG